MTLKTVNVIRIAKIALINLYLYIISLPISSLRHAEKTDIIRIDIRRNTMLSRRSEHYCKEVNFIKVDERLFVLVLTDPGYIMVLLIYKYLFH